MNFELLQRLLSDPSVLLTVLGFILLVSLLRYVGTLKRQKRNSLIPKFKPPRMPKAPKPVAQPTPSEEDEEDIEIHEEELEGPSRSKRQ